MPAAVWRHDFHASVLVDKYHESQSAAYPKRASREIYSHASNMENLVRKVGSVEDAAVIAVCRFDEPRFNID